MARTSGGGGGGGGGIGSVNVASGAATIGMAHKFVVTAGVYNLGTWSKVSGLSVKWDLAEHRIGNSDQYFKFAGIPKFERLKLSRAADGSTETVKTWLSTHVLASGGTPDEGSVQVFTPAGIAVVTWDLHEMFPIAWQISEFDASASKVAVETLEIVHAGFLPTGRRYGSAGGAGGNGSGGGSGGASSSNGTRRP
jgi:phage tail-like protein